MMCQLSKSNQAASLHACWCILPSVMRCFMDERTVKVLGCLATQAQSYSIMQGRWDLGKTVRVPLLHAIPPAESVEWSEANASYDTTTLMTCDLIEGGKDHASTAHGSVISMLCLSFMLPHVCISSCHKVAHHIRRHICNARVAMASATWHVSCSFVADGLHQQNVLGKLCKLFDQLLRQNMMSSATFLSLVLLIGVLINQSTYKVHV